MLDSKGAIYEGRGGLDGYKKGLARVTNKNNMVGSLADVIKGSDVFIGVSKPKILTADLIKLMGEEPIVFAIKFPAKVKDFFKTILGLFGLVIIFIPLYYTL